MDSTIMNLCVSIVTVVGTAVAGYLATWLSKKTLAQNIANKKTLAATAIRFVEQAYYDLGGPTKYEKAAEWLTNTAVNHGLKVTETEVKGLIESALKEAKDTFTDTWKKDETITAAVTVASTVDVDKIASVITQELTNQGVSTTTATSTTADTTAASAEVKTE